MYMWHAHKSLKVSHESKSHLRAKSVLPLNLRYLICFKTKFARYDFKTTFVLFYDFEYFCLIKTLVFNNSI